MVRVPSNDSETCAERELLEYEFRSLEGLSGTPTFELVPPLVAIQMIMIKTKDSRFDPDVCRTCEKSLLLPAVYRWRGHIASGTDKRQRTGRRATTTPTLQKTQ